MSDLALIILPRAAVTLGKRMIETFPANHHFVRMRIGATRTEERD